MLIDWKVLSAGFLVLVLPALGAAVDRGANTLELTLQEAIKIALSEQANPTLRLADERVVENQASVSLSRAPLLPHIEASLAQQSQTRNLEALGLKAEALFRPPTLVGPFSTFDARAAASQTLLHLGAVSRYRSSQAGLNGARLERESVADQVASATAQAYVMALRAKASVAAAQSGQELASALLRLAQNQKLAGTGTGIEVTRAEVQLAREQQRVLAAQLEMNQSILRLLEQMGLDMETPVALGEELAFASQLPDLELALQQAFQFRADLGAQQMRLRESSLRYQAARRDRLPSLVGFADYGTVGTALSNTIPTWTLGVSLKVPIFDGGSIDAQRVREMSRMRQAEARIVQLRRRVELEVRLSLQALQLAEAQISVAREGLELARQELEQARRRYQAGVASSLEVSEAQTRLQEAEEAEISALHGHNLARVSLAEATGTVRQLGLP